MKVALHKEHRWLEQFIGNWIALPDPENPDCMNEWVENGEMLHGVWLIVEGRGVMPDGEPAKTQLTLGYNSARGKFIGTWIGTMAEHLWVYDGTLDETGKVLTLDCEGPDFENPAILRRYQDIYTIKDANNRSLTSLMQGEDGTWTQLMQAHYRRSQF